MSLHVDKSLRKALSHIKAGELAEAEKLYKLVLSKFPKNKKAIQGYQKLKVGITSKGELKSEPPQEQVQELLNLYNQGQFEEVLLKIRPLINLFSEAVILYNIQGTVNETLQMYEKAIDSYKQAIKIKPNCADTYFNLGNAFNSAGDLDAAIDSYKKAIRFKPDDADAFCNMGNALQSRGDLDAAIESYKQALKIKPDLFAAYDSMGSALRDMGELDAAIDSYKQAIKIKPDYAKVKHLVASLTGETTKAAPREYVEELFDHYAAKFEHSLIEKLQYQTPKIITEMIINRHPRKTLGSVLDLGCGTGLAGLELRQFCENLDGIDLSEAMLRQARAKDVYDKLIHGDIAEHLAEADLDFDYFISTDVFIYVGELSDVFRLIKSRNRRRAKLVFSTEHAEGKDFYLEKSGRY